MNPFKDKRSIAQRPRHAECPWKNFQQCHPGSKPLAYASLGDIRHPNPSSTESGLLLFPGPSYMAHISKGQQYKMSWLWVAVSRNSRTSRRSDISPGGLTSRQMAFPLLMIYLSEQIHSGVSRGGEQLVEQSSGRPGAHLQSTFPKKSPTYLKRSSHRPVTAHVKY